MAQGRAAADLRMVGRGVSLPQAPKSSGRVFYAVVGFLACSNALTLAVLALSPDLGRLIGGRTEQVIEAYEDRLADLRTEVDRLHSRSYVQAGDINLQMQEVAQAQEVLSEQHRYVKLLADKAAALGLVAPVGSSAPETLVGQAASPAAGDLASTTEALTAMIGESRLALATIAQSATTSADTITTALEGVGIAIPTTALAEGGPLLPPIEDAQQFDTLDAANAAMAALERLAAARGAFDSAPVHAPLLDDGTISSVFGNRRDPFTGRLAFHAGLDFPAPSGTTVLAAGAGTVTFVGQRSGYGNVVEITHDDGLLTRYGHLSAFIAGVGDRVAAGAPIAKVGSTGRSTGPHLHFEVRRDDQAINPLPFLAAGNALATA